MPGWRPVPGGSPVEEPRDRRRPRCSWWAPTTGPSSSRPPSSRPAGAGVLRCHEPGEPAFPCNALDRGPDLPPRRRVRRGGRRCGPGPSSEPCQASSGWSAPCTTGSPWWWPGSPPSGPSGRGRRSRSSKAVTLVTACEKVVGEAPVAIRRRALGASSRGGRLPCPVAPRVAAEPSCPSAAVIADIDAWLEELWDLRRHRPPADRRRPAAHPHRRRDPPGQGRGDAQPRSRSSGSCKAVVGPDLVAKLREPSARSTSPSAGATGPGCAATPSTSATPARWPCASSPTRSPGFAELGIPPAVERLVELPMGLVIVTGPDRLGEVDHPGGHARLHQPPPAPVTSSPSRTPSSTCTPTTARP